MCYALFNIILLYPQDNPVKWAGFPLISIMETNSQSY